MTSVKTKKPLHPTGRIAPPEGAAAHPDDTAHAAALIAWVHAEIRRQCADDNLDQGQLGERMGENRTFIRSCLSSTGLTFPIIQRITRGLGYRIHPYIDTTGLPGWVKLPPPTESDLAATYLNHADQTQYDEAIRLKIGELHQTLREDLALSLPGASMRSGVDGRHLRAFEEGAVTKWNVAHPMRLFRALGAVLRFAIEDPATGQLIHLTPPPTPAPVEDDTPYVAADITDKPPVDSTIGFDRSNANVFLWHTQDPKNILMFTSATWQDFINSLAANK